MQRRSSDGTDWETFCSFPFYFPIFQCINMWPDIQGEHFYTSILFSSVVVSGKDVLSLQWQVLEIVLMYQQFIVDSWLFWKCLTEKTKLKLCVLQNSHHSVRYLLGQAFVKDTLKLFLRKQFEEKLLFRFDRSGQVRNLHRPGNQKNVSLFS